jgi:hypothetical protein
MTPVIEGLIPELLKVLPIAAEGLEADVLTVHLSLGH